MRRPATREAAVIAVALAFAAGTAVVIAQTSMALRTTAVLGACTCLVAAWPIAMRVVQSTFNLFEPIVPSCAFLFALFGLRPLVVAHGGHLTYAGLQLVPAHLEKAALIGLLGSLAFVTGYELYAVRASRLRGRGETTHARPYDERAAVEFAIVAAICGTGLFLSHLASGGQFGANLHLLLSGRSHQLGHLYANSSEYVTSAPILGACGTIAIIALIGSRRPRRGETVVALLAVGATVGVFALTGSRRFVIPALAIPVVVAYLARRRQPGRALLAIGIPLVFFVLAIVPFARSEGARQNSGGLTHLVTDAVEHPQRVLSAFATGHDTEDFSALSLEVGALRHPSSFYDGRATFGDVFLAPVPSAVFSSKPVTARNSLLLRVFGHPCAPTAGGCPDFSALGTFYQDFWYPGVVLEMAALGALAALIWFGYQRSPADPRRVVLAATTTVLLPIMIRAGFMPAFAWVLYFLLPTYFAIWLAKVAGQAEAREAAGTTNVQIAR